MPLYECVFIARQDISSNQVEGLVGQFTGIIEENGGQVAKTEMWGLRNLAYRINKNRKGHYALLNLDAPAVAIHEMERNMRLNEDVIRYLTIRVAELEEGPSIVLQSKHSRDDRGGRGGRGGFRGDRGGDRGGGRGDDRGGGRGGDRGGGPRASGESRGDGDKGDKRDLGKDQTAKTEAGAKPEEETGAKAEAKPEEKTEAAAVEKTKAKPPENESGKNESGEKESGE